jgi:hypothetical protein
VRSQLRACRWCGHRYPPPQPRLWRPSQSRSGRLVKVEYIRYTGRFVGTTALGAYRMAFEIVAPDDPGLGLDTPVIREFLGQYVALP